MKGSMKVSIFSYLRTFILFQLFNVKSKFYYLLLCSSAPLFLGLPAVASPTVGQQIAQVSTPSINRPSLKVGSQGEVVTELQAALKLLGFYSGAVDGKFSDSTAVAVSQFKQAAGLTADSVVDAATWQRLFPGETSVSSNASLPSPTSSFPVPTQTAADLPRPVVISNPASTEPRPSGYRANGSAQQLETVRTTSKRQIQNTTSTATARTNSNNRSGRTNNSLASASATTRTSTSNRSGRTNNTSNTTNTTGQKPGIQYTAAGLPILRLGMRGEEVLDLQKKLQRLGYLKTNPDGDFGAETLSAVKALQEHFGMEADGVAGGATWDILNRRRNRSQS